MCDTDIRLPHAFTREVSAHSELGERGVRLEELQKRHPLSNCFGREACCVPAARDKGRFWSPAWTVPERLAATLAREASCARGKFHTQFDVAKRERRGGMLLFRHAHVRIARTSRARSAEPESQPRTAERGCITKDTYCSLHAGRSNLEGSDEWAARVAWTWKSEWWPWFGGSSDAALSSGSDSTAADSLNVSQGLGRRVSFEVAPLSEAFESLNAVSRLLFSQ